MGMTIDKNNYYSSLISKFTPNCTIKSSSPFINMTLRPARKLKYNSKDIECEVIENENNRA